MLVSTYLIAICPILCAPIGMIICEDLSLLPPTFTHHHSLMDYNSFLFGPAMTFNS